MMKRMIPCCLVGLFACELPTGAEPDVDSATAEVGGRRSNRRQNRRRSGNVDGPPASAPDLTPAPDQTPPPAPSLPPDPPPPAELESEPGWVPVTRAGPEPVTERIPGDTVVYRVEAPETQPFALHESPYYDPSEYGRPYGTYEVTYVADNPEILEQLRAEQGYFEEGMTMHQTTLAEIMEQAGEDAEVFIDEKFNITVVGDEEGSGYVIVRPVPYRPAPDALPAPPELLPENQRD